MPRNPKTVMKQNAALRAELADVKKHAGKLSDALGVMLDQAEAQSRRFERLENQQSDGAR